MSKPYNAQGTRTRFYVPKTLAADFTEFLDNDIPNTVMNFEHVPDWYARSEDGYEAVYIRGEQYPDSTKSRYTNTDHNLNIRCDIASGIRKGDMLIDENDNVYVLDWDVTLESNNAPSRGLKCNAQIQVERYHEEVTDDNGILVEPEGYSVIVEKIPCNAYRYEGRPEYNNTSGTPGVTPNALRLLTVQYNEQTKNIMEGDIFHLGNVKYIVADVDRVGLDVNEEFGVLTIQARKAPGGLK